ncbi:MAG: T9SS type A sorting domain-containing protein [Candidatus Zixiibacteriota bacterium]|nr:MAG: T9SS type A sorting domain-containing protein [candidate division Zixibacteria bacterium]
MKAFIAILSLAICFMGLVAYAGDPGQTYQFSNRDGNRVVRIDTPHNGSFEPTIKPKRPIRNPSIMAQVLWIDRSHENAIAENVVMVPDGSGIFVGWWLNNERYSAYVSAGMNSPAWTYRHETDWWLPVDATNSKFCGTANEVPVYVWEHDSPLFINEFQYPERYKGKGISFSGDGNLMAAVAKLNNQTAILIVYDLIAQDTIFTRSFVPTTELYGVDFSHDGSTIVVSNYGGLLVYDVPAGNLIGSLYNYSQNEAEISGDGTRIVIGTFSGNVILYEWNGTSYITKWSINTGHDWVRALAISTDGSTFGCGTIEFLSGGWTGKFMLIDADSGTVLIDYDEYGDEVCAVDISADGQYAIAGCYGQLDGTYGDVVTCFRRDTNIPIFQLLDDIDETGSIMGVAISDSGNYAVAGGKEVHARIMGNGGMVYSIKINDPLNNDVAVASIDEPGEFLNPGESVIPTATFINVGENNASFTANCTITDIDSGIVVYSSSFGVSDLPSFSTSVVYFSPDFTMPAEGRYMMEIVADMANDEDLSNNDLSLILRSWHDIKITEIISPFDEVTYNWPMIPIVTCKNFGSYMENFDILLTIYDSLDIQVFATQASVFSMQPYVEEETQFSEWTPDQNGIYRIEIEAVVPDDYFPDDNIAVKYFEVKNEMIYDDGVPEVDIWVNLYPYSTNRKFAQRFELNLTPPFNITNMRFFIGDINYTGYFDYVGVCKELGGLPDTADYLVYESNPSLAGPGRWTSVDFNGYVTDNRPLWAVLHWADVEDLGPFIGGDESGILDEQSYWYANGEGWNLYTWRDWMIRLTLQEPITGVETEYISGLPRKLALRQNYPNPFNPNTNLLFELPNPGHVKIEIFGLTGARVRTLVDSHFDAGYHSAVWDGKSDSGEEVASGVYYYRLTSGQHRITRKMTMLK